MSSRTSYTDPTEKALETLSTLSQQNPDQSTYYDTFTNLLSSKLYHQLTVSIHDFTSNKSNIRYNTTATIEENNNFLSLYNYVLLPIVHKCNSLTVSRIGFYVAFSLCSSTSSTSEEDFNFSLLSSSSEEDYYEKSKLLLQNLISEFEKNIVTTTSSSSDGGDNYHRSTMLMNGNSNGSYTTAKLFTESKLHYLTLKHLEKTNVTTSTTTTTTTHNREETLENIKLFLTNNKPLLHELANSTESDIAIVHSAYYECAMTYRKVIGPPEAFYKEAISYLHYTPVSMDDVVMDDDDDKKESSTNYQELYTLATDLSLSALTGHGVYNFGEVVHNNSTILQILKNTKNQYLVELMEASANGDVDALGRIFIQYKDDIANQPALVHRMDVVKEKITLLALVNMVFERPSHERTLQFVDIAERTKMDVDQVEWIVMRALSLGLIKGSMDQVDQTVDVTWVMPRVLDEANMKNLAERFGEWAVKVSKTREYMSEHIPVTFG